MFFMASKNNKFIVRFLSHCITLAILSGAVQAQDVEFDSSLLGIDKGSEVDLTRFSRIGYVTPGEYTLMIQVNRQDIKTHSIKYYSSASHPEESTLCLTPELANIIGIKKSVLNNIPYSDGTTCLDASVLEGFTASVDFATRTLIISVPHALLEYTDTNWDPPSRWDHGINGLLFDYNLNATTTQYKSSGERNSVSGTGVAGANLGAWRMRADWQARRDEGYDHSDNNQWQWNRVYLYRPLTESGARLTLGEDYYTSRFFGTFRFLGVSLQSDERMLPPGLRGYSPEVSGIARTNATIIISQGGRVLYERQVAAGAFQIQDISSYVTGTLDVVVREQDGTEQKFQVETANIPYLTRPGQVRYNLVSGDVSNINRDRDKNPFAGGEFSWGVNSGWSLYGGLLASKDYYSGAVGIGRDLVRFGAISADVTQAVSRLKEGTKTGKSWRLSYSKRFDEINSQITFAGYRFSEPEYLNMSDFSWARHHGYDDIQRGKEMYTLSATKQFADPSFSLSMNFNHQTYWNRSDSDNYSASFNTLTSVGPIKNISLIVSAFQNQYRGNKDNGGYLQVSLPLGTRDRISYNMNVYNHDVTNTVGYSRVWDDGDNLQINAGRSRSYDEANGFWSTSGDFARMDLTGAWQESNYRSAGLGLEGGVTITGKGSAVHPGGNNGTRLLVDTDGVDGIPFQGGYETVNTRFGGHAVLTNLSDYSRTTASVDTTQIPDFAEVKAPVSIATYTEGAIGYQKFDVLSGARALVNVRTQDNSVPPLGTPVIDERNYEAGIVNDDGTVWLSGMRAGEKMKLTWGDRDCVISLPSPLPEDMNDQTLTCQ